MILELMAGPRETPAGSSADYEAEIIARARADPEDFAPLYERYFARVYAYCLRRVESSPEAEDLCSLIFTRALTGLGSYRGGSAAAWLFRIAHNTVANHYRDRKPAISLDREELPEAVEPSEPDVALDGLLRAEERERIRRLVAALPYERRELLELMMATGLSAKETGVVIGRSEGAVRAMLHRTLQQLRSSYQRDEERPG